MISVVGEALVDLVGEPDGRTFRAHPGGSPANVALGLARLGLPASLTTRVGDDAFGRLLLDHLVGNGVRLEPDPVGPEPTSLAIATLDEGGAATYDFRITWDTGPLPPVAAGVTALHAGSLGLVLEPGAGEVLRLMQGAAENGVTVSYDPNVRPGLAGERSEAVRWVERVAGVAQIVKVSSDDLAWLYPGRAAHDIARAWAAQPATALVVVTRGEHGLVAVSAEHEVELPAPRVHVVDTVGAGDAFMAGLLAGLDDRGLLGGELPAGFRRTRLSGSSREALSEALELAAKVGAITCSRAGANPPTRAEVAAARF